MRSLLMMSLVTVLAGGVMAQGGMPVEQGKDEKAVSAAVEALRKAMVDPDKATLEKLTLPQLSYGHSNGMIQNQTVFIEALTSKQSDFVNINLSEQSIKIVDRTAIVRHILSADTNDGGKPGHVNLSILLVWQKVKGEWRLLARQAVKVVPAP
ncbi:MAG TPA: nuclear transport factor 2 family protein [Puia sp.]|nr:nuclear transport factor 2 family protein [Puia sp.]